MKNAQTIRPSDYELNKVKEDIQQSILPMLLNQFTDGQLIQNINLVAGQDNLVNHKLNRPVTYWTVVRGPIVSDNNLTSSEWISFTPTGAWTGSVVYTGKYRQVGNVMEGFVQIIGSGAPTGTFLSINIPSGFTIKTADIPGNVTRYPVGSAVYINAGIETYRGVVFYENTTSIVASVFRNAGTHIIDDIVSNTNPFSFNTGDIVSVNFKIPISEWAANNASNFSLWENTSEFPSKYLKLRTNVSCTVSLYVG